jgi:G3E family GTPase
VFTRDPLAGRIPVTLITGFLGSGKTTLLSKLIRHPAMAGAAVVINEVGEIGIDHDLVTMASENVALLANGCICCSVRTDLQETLRDLFARRHAGEIPDFDRLIIETTGLADPAPVVQTLASDTLLAAQFRLDGLVTLVDGAQALQQLAAHGEPAKQIALADRVFITKADLVDEARRQAVEQAVRALNPRAPVSTLLHGEVNPAELTGLGLASARASQATLSFLGEPLAGVGAAGERHLGQRPALHDASIRTLSLRFETPFAWPAFSAALELLTTLRGPDLLRVKGIVNVEGKPVVVQGVQHIFHDPVELDRWPSTDTGTRLVFITRHIEAGTIRNLMSAVAAASPAAQSEQTPTSSR